MSLSIEEILPTVYRYYPRGVHAYDPAYSDSEEYRRLLAVRKDAGTGARRATWDAMVERLVSRLSGCALEDRTLLYPANYDTGYHVRIHLNPEDKRSVRAVVGWVSAIVPCYIIYSSSGAMDPSEPPLAIRFSFTHEEQSIADILAVEIEDTYGYTLLPPDVGNIRVPDVAHPAYAMGANNVYDLLFVEHIW